MTHGVVAQPGLAHQALPCFPSCFRLAGSPSGLRLAVFLVYLVSLRPLVKSKLLHFLSDLKNY